MSKSSSSTAPAKAKILAFVKIVALLAIILCALFYQNFDSGMVLFSNDGPLGGLVSTMDRMPTILMGYWQDLNSIGSNSGSETLNVTTTIKLFWECLFSGTTGPLGFANTYAPIALFIMGLGAWAFFRKLKLSPRAVTLGALAVMLNTQFFSGACWGVASDQIAFGFNYLALALVVANDDGPAPVIFWTRLALAGFCLGINVMEAADVGALCSMFVAAFILYKSLVENNAPAATKIGRGIGRIAVVSIFAGFIACQTVYSIWTTQIEGVSTTGGQAQQSDAAKWDYATQWSLPKQETLGIFVPGLFGYRMDTPLNTVPFMQSLCNGGMYWGGMGCDPGNDRYFDSGGRDNPPSSMMRFGYGGYYCGILVALVAFWSVAQSFRRQNSPFTDVQRKFIWFWSVTVVLCLVMAWGRFEPPMLQFCRVFFHLPLFSYMRNPAKFLTFVEWSLTVLFAYGVHGLSQRYLAEPPPANAPEKEEDKFDQRWLLAAGGIFAACVFGWLLYASGKAELVQYLKYRGFPDNDTAKAIASFSIEQVAWFLVLFAVALVMLTVIINGYCAGKRAKWAVAALGLFLVFNLSRADLPFIIHWNIKQKYEVGNLNPVLDFLRQKPYEHRVALLPFDPPPGQEFLNELYGIEWSQHLFLYYDIQSLDIVQMPRMPVDILAFQREAFLPQDQSQAYLYARLWQLTNTRYLLGPAGFLDVMNAQLDPLQHRFQIVQRFDINLKPGVQQYDGDSAELTAIPENNGPYALFDFTGALPRAKLYTDWQTNSVADLASFRTNGLSDLDSMIFDQVGTNDFITIKKLTSPFFDPEQTVLVDGTVPAASPTTNTTPGTVEFASYAPKKIVLNVNATAPSVLLLNDHYDPNWRVTIDGQAASLFHANYIMQGLFVPAGQHTVEYRFSIASKPFYVTVLAICVGIALCGVMVFYKRSVVKPARKF